MTYEEQLQDKRWYNKRVEILIRDNNECQRCFSMNHLQVHHLYYESGKLAWQYPNDALTTLCKRCHEITHGKMSMHSRAERILPLNAAILDFIENLQNHGK